MQQQRGFTVIEIIVVIAFLAFAGALFFWQKNDLRIAERDNQRKVAINAMYYSLEEVFYATNKSYPRVINADVLKSMDPELFKDPNGVAVGEQASDYRYEPSGCEGDICQGYVLRADLESEADFVKTSNTND